MIDKMFSFFIYLFFIYFFGYTDLRSTLFEK